MKNKYEVRGDHVVISLNRKDGTVLETLIDIEDLPIADAFPYTWYAQYNHYNDSFYVVGNDRRNGEHKCSILHREIMKTPEGMVTDHKGHDTLDNRKSNLRNVDYSINNHNRKNGRKDSVHPGVRLSSYQKSLGKEVWVASISLNGKRKKLGRFKSKEEAIKAVETARKEYFDLKLKEG